jgi:hypothetical protein
MLFQAVIGACFDVIAGGDTAVIVVTYTCKNSDGFDVPSYFSGRCGRNLDGQVVVRRCWGPSASEGPQNNDLTKFLEYDT